MMIRLRLQLIIYFFKIQNILIILNQYPKNPKNNCQTFGITFDIK